MAKKSVKNRNLKREKCVAQFAERRAALVAVTKDPNASLEDKAAAYKKILSMPRDASASRIHNRCSITGRPRGYYRKFGVSRIVFRELAHEGFLPGVRKASW
ncbi:MAG: 30S ribosomal protein S14 [Planctomycetota bacterium]|jgi:small subunit ribosomal protein S14|nr:30S ribosomal protein S14 [Planctomycetota bacterium]MDP6941826.1 30S ribosomal protein S14 [Planctomycetota bacterium]